MENLYFLQVMQAGSERLAESEFKLKVTGTSMSPFIKLGDDVFVKQESLSSLSIGDVVVVIRETDFVTHRLVKISQDNYLCKGDNTYIPDLPVSGEQIFGKVIAIERASKRISLDNKHWKIRNRVLGRLGNLESQIYVLALRFGGQQSKNHDRNTRISIGRIVFFPFRAIMRLIVR